jgi:hypothetical protein
LLFCSTVIMSQTQFTSSSTRTHKELEKAATDEAKGK